MLLEHVAFGTLVDWLATRQWRVAGSAPILVARAIANDRPEWVVMVAKETQRCSAITGWLRHAGLD